MQDSFGPDSVVPTHVLVALKLSTVRRQGGTLGVEGQGLGVGGMHGSPWVVYAGAIRGLLGRGCQAAEDCCVKRHIAGERGATCYMRGVKWHGEGRGQ